MRSERKPAWLALTTQQQHLGTGGALARRYYAEVAPIAAVCEWNHAAQDALADLLAPGESVYLVDLPPDCNTPRLQETKRLPCLQMYFTMYPTAAHPAAAPARLHPPSATIATVALDSERDAAAMLALTDVAFPGFFRIGTPRMGRYRGVRVNGELLAMTGERMCFPGHREVSAVCTHPAHTGQGYAQQLIREVTETILSDGDAPLLHVSASNARAIAVYQHLGFVRSTSVDFVQLTRTR